MKDKNPGDEMHELIPMANLKTGETIEACSYAPEMIYGFPIGFENVTEAVFKKLRGDDTVILKCSRCNEGEQRDKKC